MASSSTIFSNGAWNGLATPNSSLFSRNRGRAPSSFLLFPRQFMPEIACNSSRLRIFHREVASKCSLGVPIVSCLVGENSGTDPESKDPSIPSDSPEKAAIDIKLPRRSLLVKFTCNACGERSAKLVNRLAYERGTVFVQCSGCFQHHKLVDNLGLVVEYDFREELDADSNAKRH